MSFQSPMTDSQPPREELTGRGKDPVEHGAATTGDSRIRVFDMESVSLGSLSFHGDCEFLTRLTAPGFPLHLAVHEISPVGEQPLPYVEMHTHQNPEVNILVSPQGNLTYLFRSGGEQFTVRAPACVWIPAGVPHAANVVSGEGFLVALILSDGFEARRG
jgi:hypothetical protein